MKDKDRESDMNEKTESECCGVNVIHEEIVRSVACKLPEEAKVEELSHLFKMLGDPTRIKILFALNTAELCVCDISALLSMSQSAISHQLRFLKQARLVKARREGKMIFYSPSDTHVKEILEQSITHIFEDAEE